MVFVGKKKTRRKGAYPKSILDKAALAESLEEAGVKMKQMHLDNFYQALHRQHYPPLPDFVENYYRFERKEDALGSGAGGGGGAASSAMVERPLVHKVTSRKNKNLFQLPKAFLEFLRDTPDFVTCTSKVQQKLTSQDKSTTKLIVELHDGKVVESVLMRYERKGSGRASLCVSSQCGCAMGCTFCATGTMGLSGNLTTAEILEQLVHADSILAEEYGAREDKSKRLDLVRNIVFMGMGEPLDNYNNVVGACRAMMDRKRWNLAHGRVTVSTVGLVSQIRKLTKELPEVSLALSLHAPNQEMRTAIVPTAARYPIEHLIDALDNHMMAYLKKRVGDNFTEEERIKESSRRRAMIEYVMLQGDTSSFESAHQLGKLCENRHLVVNLIPYNATDVKDKLQCPSNEHMQQFRDIVASYGAFCTIRRTMGADIASACGQLVQNKKGNGDGDGDGDDDTREERDIEDVVGKTGSMKRDEAASGPVEGVVVAADRSSVATGEESSANNTPKSSPAGSWLASVPSEDLDRWTNLLTAASVVSAAVFVGSLIMRRRR